MFDDTVFPWAFGIVLFLLLWRFRKQSQAKFRSIDAVPGPKASSFLKGEWIIVLLVCAYVKHHLGHLPQLFATNAWQFLDHLTNDFASVVRLRGLFGVRILFAFLTTTNGEMNRDEYSTYSTLWRCSTLY